MNKVDLSALPSIPVHKSVDWSRPLATRDGRRVRVLASDLAHDRAPIAVAILSDDGAEELVRQYAPDGKVYRDDTTKLDIVNVPEPPKTIKGWMNIYPARGGHGAYLAGTSFVYPSRDNADKNASPHRIACIEVEFPEGGGLT